MRKCSLNCREDRFGKGHIEGWNVVTTNCEGYNWDVSKWKKIVAMKVQEVGLRKWKSGMERKSTLKWYGMKEVPKGVCYYTGSWGCELLFKARSQSLEVNARTYKWNENKSKECKMCGSGQVESVYHVIVECVRYERERSVLIQEVCNEWGTQFINNWAENADGYMCQLLGIVGVTNRKTIEAVKEYLVKAWTVRKCGVNGNSVNGRSLWDHSYSAQVEVE